MHHLCIHYPTSNLSTTPHTGQSRTRPAVLLLPVYLPLKTLFTNLLWGFSQVTKLRAHCMILVICAPLISVFLAVLCDSSNTYLSTSQWRKGGLECILLLSQNSGWVVEQLHKYSLLKTQGVFEKPSSFSGAFVVAGNSLKRPQDA